MGHEPINDEPRDGFDEHGTRDRLDKDLSAGDDNAADLVDPATDETNAITTNESDGSGEPE